MSSTMASMLYTTFGVMLFMAGSHCTPIRHTTGQKMTDCFMYGSNCMVDMNIPSGKVVDVNFQKNVTQAIMTALPNIEVTQNKTTKLLETYDTYLKNITNTINVALQKQEVQMQNLTSKMAGLLDNVAILLQNQLSVLSERLPVLLPARDCKDIAAQGAHVSGPYKITPQDGLGSFTVYCDMDTDSGGWTVFQRRHNGTIDFYRGWHDYEHGFGSPDGEFWAGLQHIHRLTRTGTWILRIDIKDFNGTTEYAQYESFEVGDARTHYQLNIGSYSGNGNDRLAYHNHQAFSTKDSDHDDHSVRHCAQYYKGGWWYNACHYSNLNGLYLGKWGDRYTGMVWNGRKSKKISEMKMRRVQ